MLDAGSWVLDGMVTAEFVDQPALTWTLARGYASEAACFAETQTSQHGGVTNIEIDVHPKDSGMVMTRLSVKWQLPQHSDLRPHNAERTIALTVGPDPLIVWSERENEAATLLRLETSSTLTLERNFADLALAHSLPALRLYVGPASRCPALNEVLSAPASGRSLLVSPAWLEEDNRALHALLASAEWAELDVQALILDARLTLSAPFSSLESRRQWQAFAKTCADAGLDAGITALPQLWSELGHGVPRKPHAPAKILTPAWATPTSKRWWSSLGGYAYDINFAQQEARDALTQWLLWLGELGYRQLTVMECGPSQIKRSVQDGREHLSRLFFLDVLRADGQAFCRFADASLSPEQAVGTFLRQWDWLAAPRGLPPKWWRPASTRISPIYVLPKPVNVKDPTAVLRRRLGLDLTGSSPPDSLQLKVVDLGAPPLWASPPAVPLRHRLSKIARLLKLSASTSHDGDTVSPEIWPPASTWKALRNAFSAKPIG